MKRRPKIIAEKYIGRLRFVLALVVMCSCSVFKYSVIAQTETTPKEWQLSAKPNIKLKLNASAQLWYRYTELNPGSLDGNQNLQTSDFDLSLRRLRLGSRWSVGERFKFYTVLGENNYNKASTKSPLLKVLDLYGTYKFSDKINIALGKSTWDGLSRYTAPATTRMLALDLPLIAQPTLNKTDDVTRNLSAFVYGDFGRLNYRIGIIDPYSYSYTGASNVSPAEGISDFSYDKLKLQYTGYFKYDFLDKEYTSGPNFNGTFLGSKQVLALGAGFKYQPDAMSFLQEEELQYHDMRLWAVDVFTELPLHWSFARAFTGYVGCFNYDFGPDYLRNIGVNNPASGGDNTYLSLNGKGNAFPVMGTGTSVYWQLGLLLGQEHTKTIWKNIQIYNTGQWSNFDALNNNMFAYSFGVNWYINNQKMKLSIGGQNRPVFSTINDSSVEIDRKWMGVLQFQYLLN
ncbi:porin [Formosa sp. A9]|uniref:porin n=1 Tax=Formosa sp. A9 TaxID=3442641 RepID=UPI003EBBC953